MLAGLAAPKLLVLLPRSLLALLAAVPDLLAVRAAHGCRFQAPAALVRRFLVPVAPGYFGLQLVDEGRHLVHQLLLPPLYTPTPPARRAM